MTIVTDYFHNLIHAIGDGWNRFWFTPVSARTLGGIRIAAGLLALYAIATYGPDLDRFFASDGMLPMPLLRELMYRPEGRLLGPHSLLDYTPDSLLWPTFYVSLAVVGLFTLGIGGRFMAIAAAVLTISFFARAPLVISAFEAILSFLLVYLCIGRASDALSVPSLFRRKAALQAPPPQRPASNDQRSASVALASPLNTIALRLIQIHVVAVHLMMGYAQLAAPESTWWSGEGLWLAAGRPGMALVDVYGLEDHPRLIAAWSHAITIYLLSMPVFVWIRLARPLVLAVGAAIWISVALATGWVPFAFAMITGLVAFVPPAANRLSQEPHA